MPVSAVLYTAPDLIPANMRRFAAILYPTGETAPSYIRQYPARVFLPTDTLPAGERTVGVVKYAPGDAIPVNLRRVVVVPPGSTSYVTAVLADAPLGFWRLSETSGTTAADLGSGANAGTYTGGVTVGQLGRLGGLSVPTFDGGTGLVLLPDIDALDGAAAFTLEAWVNPAALAVGLNNVVSKWLANTQNTLAMSVSNTGTVRVFVSPSLTDAGNASGTATGNIVALNQWTHIAAVYDGSQTGNAARLVIYVNGVLRSMTFGGTIPATTPASGTAAVRIGQLGGATQWWNGGIADVAIYTTALSAARIAAHYAAAGR